ncbi:MAG: leucyl/phenylalanyl-tRNA--protein transferase [Planctomycetota bacterium]
MDEVRILDADGVPITWREVLQAYAERCFPMAETRSGALRWYRPRERAVITWSRWRVPKSLRKLLRHEPFRITRNAAFPAVIAGCAARGDTWISHDVERLYCDLHRRGWAHSVEAWQGETLVGGLYGLSLGAAFCGESMFHRVSDASKACLVDLVEHLRACDFAFLDIQQDSEHLRRFGSAPVDDAAYAAMLAPCLERYPAFA